MGDFEDKLSVIGWVYLIKLDRPYPNGGNPQYYLGWTELDPKIRLQEHRSGRGANFLKHCNDKGIGYKIVRVWRKKDRHFERKLKNQKNLKRHCPICNKKLWRYKARKYIKL